MRDDCFDLMELLVCNVQRKGFEWKLAFLQIHDKRGERR